MSFVRFLYKTGKNRYGQHKCDHCGKLYITRIRERKHDTCGCRGSRFQHGEGDFSHPEYKVWIKMRERCSNPTSAGYENYGGRGIAVCERWSNYANFIFDMGRRPSDHHSIERIDVNGSYAPGNCKWATKLEQARNTRANFFVTIDQHHHTVGEWLTELAIPRTTFYRNLKRFDTPIKEVNYRACIVFLVGELYGLNLLLPESRYG